MTKIAYFSPYFWPEAIGSAPYCTDIARRLAEEGHDVNVWAFRPYYPRADLFPEWQDGSRDEETVDGLKITRVSPGKRQGGGFAARLNNDLRYFAHSLKAAFSSRTKGVDCVVAYVPSMFCALAAAAVARVRGAKLIVVVHDIESGLARSLGIVRSGFILGAMQALERFGLNRADRVVVLTAGMKDELRAIGCKRPIDVLPIWSEIYPPRAGASDTVTIGYSGNFGKKQALDQLLPLIDMIGKQRPDIRVLLRGDGSEKPALVAAVQAMGVTNVSFADLVPQEQFVDALQEIDIHLVPQALNVANYALPSKLISIMAAGRAYVCVAERNSPITQIAAESGGGACVEPASDQALFDVVVALADDRARRDAMGAAGQRYVAERMSRDGILKSYSQMIA